MEEFDLGDEGYWKMEEFGDYSNSYECHGKLSRIWRNGVNLGKKMVITGVVVSSAPFVLPPLVALSAIGVAFSVPAGFVFATYACGEKLMNTLLPISNPYEENGIVFCDDGQYRDYKDIDMRGWYEDDEDLEVEECEFGEDGKELEMRIEFVEENNYGFDDHDETPAYMDELDKRSSNLSEIIEEGYGDNVREYVAEEEQQPMDSKPYCEIIGGIAEVEVATEISLLQKEGVQEPRMGEIVEVDYEEVVGEYMADEERPIDAEIPNILEGMIKEAEDEISLMEKEEGRLLSVSENFDEEFEEDVGEYKAGKEQPIDAKSIPILEGVEEVENDVSLMEKEEDRMTRVSEITEDEYKDDNGEYMEDEEQPLDAKEIPESVQGTEEAGHEIFLMEKEEGRIPEVSEVVDESYEEKVEEYMENEEQPLDAKEIPDILEGIKEAEAEISLTEKKEGQGLRLSEVAVDGDEENVGEYIVDEERFLDAKEIPELLEGMKQAKNVNYWMKDSRVPSFSEVGEEESEDVGEYMSDEEQPSDAKAILEILKEIEEGANEDSLMKKEKVGMPRDPLTSFVAQLGRENEINVGQAAEGTTFISRRGIKEESAFTGIEEDKLTIDSTKVIEEIRNNVWDDDHKRKDSPLTETPKGNEESRTLPAKYLSRDKGNRNITISEEAEPTIDDKGPKISLKSENNVKQVTDDISFLQTRNINEGNGFSGIEPDELRSETTTKETSAGNELSGITSVKEIPQNYEKKNLSIPKVVELATAKKGVTSGLKNENNVEQVAEEMAFVASADIKRQNGFATEEEEEKQNEMTKLIEKMRDEHSERKGMATPEPHVNVKPRSVSIELMSEDKESTSHTIIPKGLKPAMNDRRDLFNLRSEVNIENTSIDEDEPRSSIANHLVATMKIDDDHTVTKVHQGASSQKLRNSILSNEDTREKTVKSGFAVLDNRTMTPHQIVDSFNQMLEGEDQSTNNMVEVTEVSVDYHEVATESTMPLSGLLGDTQCLNNMGEVSVDYEIVIGSALRVPEPAETAKDQGTTSSSDKVKHEEEQIWEDINAMRTIVGYTNAPHLSCAEELKALYDFTGVELPTLSNDSIDLADINEKLHFLMLIIGVK